MARFVSFICSAPVRLSWNKINHTWLLCLPNFFLVLLGDLGGMESWVGWLHTLLLVCRRSLIQVLTRPEVDYLR